MLQLPSKAPKFTRAQIADITRGSKARVRVQPKKDPVITLIASADALLDRYYDAVNVAYEAKIKLPKWEQGRHPAIYIPDELLNVEWSNGHPFTSQKMIDQKFRGATVRARQRITDAEKHLRTIKSGQSDGLVRQLNQQINSAKRAINLFRQCRAPMKAALRKEQERLLKIQNKVGLVQARLEVCKIYRALQKVTEQIASTKPTSVEGALAVVQYVESRLWCDRPGLFSDDGKMPGHFGRIMRTANAIIADYFKRNTDVSITR